MKIPEGMILLLSGGSAPEPVNGKGGGGVKTVEIKKMFNVQGSDQMFSDMSHLLHPDWI